MKPASAIKSNPKDRDKKKTSSKFQSKKIHVAIDDCFDTIEGNVDKPNTVRIRLQWVNEILHTQESSLNSLTQLYLTV